MPEYVLLMKLTDHGAESSVDGLPKLIAKMRKTMQHLQGTMSIVLTLGEYDMVATGRANGEEELAWFCSHLAGEGHVKFTTLTGFTPEEWATIQAEP